MASSSTFPPFTLTLHSKFNSSHDIIKASSCTTAVSILPRLKNRFVGSAKCGDNLGWCSKISSRKLLGPNCGSKTTCWFRFGKNGVDAEGAGIYGSQKRDDFDRDDVEQYFNYMGMLAVEGSYDKMEALLNQNIHRVDILLLMASSEGDRPKIEELMRAGADCTIKDAEGRTALDRALSDEIRELILGLSVQ